MPVHGVPIVHNALQRLAEIGVRYATIVVGYRKEAIQRSCGRSFAGVEISYVESSAFDRTGSAYSLWLARDTLLLGDALLLEGDVFFEGETLTRLLASGASDVAAVAPFDATMTGTAVTLSCTGHIAEFRMSQTVDDLRRRSPPLFKTLNLFRFTAGTLGNTLVPALDGLVAAEAGTAYVEQLLAGLVDEARLTLQAALCGDLRWFEIDSEADLRVAEQIFSQQLDPLYRHGILP